MTRSRRRESSDGASPVGIRIRLLLGAVVVAFVIVVGSGVGLTLLGHRTRSDLDALASAATRLHTLAERYGVEVSLQDGAAKTTIRSLLEGVDAILDGGEFPPTRAGQAAVPMVAASDLVVRQTVLLAREAAERQQRKIGAAVEGEWDESSASETANQIAGLAQRLEARTQRLAEQTARRVLLWQLLIGLAGLVTAIAAAFVSRRVIATLERAAAHAARLQQRAEEGERASRAIPENALNAVVMTDQRGRIELFNREACRAFGYAADEVLGKNVSMLIPSPHKERHDSYIEGYLAEFLRSGVRRIPVEGCEVKGMKKDGTVFPAHLSVCPIRVGGQLHIVSYLYDLTRQRVAEQKLEAAHAELQTRVDQLREVAAAVATGDLTRRAVVSGNGAMHDLTISTNRMIDSLQLLVAGVQESVVQAATASSQLASASREQQHSAAERAASVAEIAASSKEIAQTSESLVETIHHVVRGMGEASTLAGGGREDLVVLDETMQRMTGATLQLTEKLGGLNEQAGSIGGVVTTITKIADQTNLLSLNAAIEAEKAGEHGRGFAVVATEIRRLADQTAVATLDIERMVGHMQKAVASGVMSVEKFTEDVKQSAGAVDGVVRRFADIIERVEHMRPQFEVVDEGMRAQAMGARQISEAISELSENARQGAEAVRQLTSGVDQLRGVSEVLRESVTKFQTAA